MDRERILDHLVPGVVELVATSRQIDKDVVLPILDGRQGGLGVADIDVGGGPVGDSVGERLAHLRPLPVAHRLRHSRRHAAAGGCVDIVVGDRGAVRHLVPNHEIRGVAVVAPHPGVVALCRECIALSPFGFDERRDAQVVDVHLLLHRVLRVRANRRGPRGELARDEGVERAVLGNVGERLAGKRNHPGTAADIGHDHRARTPELDAVEDAAAAGHVPTHAGALLREPHPEMRPARPATRRDPGLVFGQRRSVRDDSRTHRRRQRD